MKVKTFAIAFVASAMMVQAAGAEDYPTRPVTLIVPFAAGGPSDAITRLIADRLGNQLGGVAGDDVRAEHVKHTPM